MCISPYRMDRSPNNVSWSTLLPPQYKPQQHSLPGSQFAHGVAGYWVDLDLADVPAFVEEPFMPPPEILRWRVSFYYVVSGKQEDYWKAQGKFWNKDVENFLGRKKGISEAVAQTVAATDTPGTEGAQTLCLRLATRESKLRPQPPRAGAEGAGDEGQRRSGRCLAQRQWRP